MGNIQPIHHVLVYYPLIVSQPLHPVRVYVSPSRPPSMPRRSKMESAAPNNCSGEEAAVFEAHKVSVRRVSAGVLVGGPGESFFLSLHGQAGHG